MNQLETKLHAIQTTKSELKKQYLNTPGEHQKRELAREIYGLTIEEKETLGKLNISLEDIVLTAPFEKPEDDEQ